MGPSEPAEPSGAAPSRVERSPADVLRLVVAAAVALAFLLVELLFGDALVGFASDLLRGLDAVPTWIVDVVVTGTRILGVVFFGGGLVWALLGRRWRMLATAAVAAALAAVLVALRQPVAAEGGRISVDPALPLAGFPTEWGVAALAAVLTAAAPWLSRRWRRAGSALLVGTLVTAFVGSPVSFDWLAAAVAGWVAGAAVLVALGAPSRRPTAQAVIDGLASVGLPVRQLRQAGVDARGSTPYFGVGSGGDPLFVKALGEDERSADLLFRLYRRIRPGDFGDERPFSTLRRAVEHEALLALAARDLPVRTPRLRAFATAEPNGYVLAYDRIEGRSLDQLDPSEVTDGVLTAIWGLVGELRQRRIAHRDLRLANIFLDDDGGVWLIDFGFSEMAAPDLLLATDVAELVTSSSLYVGPDRATAHAVATVEPAVLTRAIERMRPWALSGATRSALKSQPGLLDELRRRLAAAGAAVDEPAR